MKLVGADEAAALAGDAAPSKEASVMAESGGPGEGVVGFQAKKEESLVDCCLGGASTRMGAGLRAMGLAMSGLGARETERKRRWRRTAAAAGGGRREAGSEARRAWTAATTGRDGGAEAREGDEGARGRAAMLEGERGG